MGLLSKIKSSTKSVAAGPKTVSYNAYCFLHSDEERIAVLETNPKFELSTKELFEKGFAGKSIYKYFYRYDNVTIEREPKNKVDKNAVKILVNGQFFGYVNADDAPAIGAAIKNGTVSNCSIIVTGGPYRRIFSENQSGAGGGELNVVLEVTYL